MKSAPPLHRSLGEIRLVDAVSFAFGVDSFLRRLTTRNIKRQTESAVLANLERMSAFRLTVLGQANIWCHAAEDAEDEAAS